MYVQIFCDNLFFCPCFEQIAVKETRTSLRWQTIIWTLQGEQITSQLYLCFIN